MYLFRKYTCILLILQIYYILIWIWCSDCIISFDTWIILASIFILFFPLLGLWFNYENWKEKKNRRKGTQKKKKTRVSLKHSISSDFRFVPPSLTVITFWKAMDVVAIHLWKLEITQNRFLLPRMKCFRIKVSFISSWLQGRGGG